MATRSRKEELRYRSYRKNADSEVCVFCALTSDSSQHIEEYKHFDIIKNIYGYSLWDSTGVEEHNMLVPKRHVASMADFNKGELQEFAQLLRDYEGQGYNLYARGRDSHMKSVIHQHTHLIKLNTKRKKFFMLVEKPYIRITF